MLKYFLSTIKTYMYQRPVKSLVLLFCLYIHAAYGQMEAANWYFGNNCALSFVNGSPVNIANSAMKATEGCAAISDSRGNMLFYTNGVTVWNKQNKMMRNGKGLKGHDSSTQSAIIVPKPGSANLYYVFTSDAGAYDTPPNVGVHYSTVDMLRDSSRGEVIEKNIKLLPAAAEKLSAVKHANGTDIWVLAHGWNTNNFYAWLVTKNGVSAPVISSLGTIHFGGKSRDANSIGQMKFSPDGKHVALTMFDSKFFEVFDFNNSTGELSNARMIYTPEEEVAYGLEFSPNGQYLYVGVYWKKQIIQYEVDYPSGAQIMATATLIGSTHDNKLGSFQLAPDGNIYITKNSSFLGVIAYPNKSGTACNYIDNGVLIKLGQLQLGLPGFIQSYFYKP
jgi:WD40 repeat protein